MNRLIAKPFASIVAETNLFSLPTSWEGGSWASDSAMAKEPTIHATFMPMHYEAGYAYPLFVWMHEGGSEESELPNVMRHISTRNHAAVAPRGQERRSAHGYYWNQSTEGISQAEQAVAETIDHVSTVFNIHSERIFIGGTGSGGTMAMRLAMLHPEWFAGAASMDGPLPRGERPLNRLKALRDFPFLLSLSNSIGTYSEERLCSDLSLLHTAGCEVTVRHYQGKGEIRPTMLNDLDRWIMEHVTG